MRPRVDLGDGVVVAVRDPDAVGVRGDVRRPHPGGHGGDHAIGGGVDHRQRVGGDRFRALVRADRQDRSDRGGEQQPAPEGKEETAAPASASSGERPPPRRALEGGILGEDRALEPLELRAGLQPELVHQMLAMLAVHLQCLRLASRPVKSQHALAGQALPVGVGTRQRLELAGDELVPAERDVGVDPILRRGQPHLREAGDLVLSERLVCEVRQGLAAPERQGLGEQLRALFRVTLGERLPAASRQRLEAVRIDLLSAHVEPVAPALGDQGICPEHLAQPRDVHLHRLRGCGGWTRTPELVDQPVG